MTHVHFLYHIDEKKTDGYHHGKLIGIYSTIEFAQAAIKHLGDRPGFRDHPDRWKIYSRTLNRDSWPEGFAKETHERLR